jgi:aminoacyl tRNA synthase complex-interacting multifunctional protein 1
MLKLQIAEAKNQSKGGVQSSGELETLKSENSGLKQEIEVWKNKLTQAEIANGKSVFAKSDAVSSTGAKVGSTPSQEQHKPAQGTKVAGGAGKAEKKEKPKKEPKPAKDDGNEPPVDVGRLDLRVGHIRSAKKHPDADSLYIEEVDVGEEKPRTVISGLVKFIPEPEMQDRMAILCCNLKPSKMRGIMSEAMVMCASTPDKVEILSAPTGCKPGDIVLVD